VLTISPSARAPISLPTRSFISFAALLVKVIAAICVGLMPYSSISQAILWVMTRVLPEPAPASTSSGLSRWRTASSWAALSFTIRGVPLAPQSRCRHFR
jgi:hypothetical protein